MNKQNQSVLDYGVPTVGNNLILITFWYEYFWGCPPRISVGKLTGQRFEEFRFNVIKHANGKRA